MNHAAQTFFILSVIGFGSACATAEAQEWQPLFNGVNFEGLMQNKSDSIGPGWSIDDGWLHLDRSKGRGGNLLSTDVYGDFELLFEWKVAEGANNGIKYRVNDFGGKTLGLEYQVIDDPNKPKLAPNHRTASIYDIYETKPHQLLRPAGEINRGRIVVRGNHIEHWLNGHLVTEAFTYSDEWNRRIAESKFSDVEGFGVISTGRIMFTDHGDEVWYRNVFVRRLDPPVMISACPSTPICCSNSGNVRVRRFWRRSSRHACR